MEIKTGLYMAEDGKMMRLESLIVPDEGTVGNKEANFVAVFSYADELGFLREAEYERFEVEDLVYLG